MGTMPPATPAAETRQDEVILRTNDEGGALTLTAQRTPTPEGPATAGGPAADRSAPAGWTRFTLLVEERPPEDLPGEDAAEALRPFLRTRGPADTWRAALGLLDSLVWEILHPEHVHPEFRPMVVSAIRERAADPDNACAEFAEDWLPGWERACSAN